VVSNGDDWYWYTHEVIHHTLLKSEEKTTGTSCSMSQQKDSAMKMHTKSSKQGDTDCVPASYEVV
jgi:hypothetical protein